MYHDISRIPSLDALRGLAIIMVVAQHCLGAFKPALPILEDLAGHGSLGVQLFFIVSGFTMMLTFGEDFNRRTILAFYIKRFFRIAPFFWLVATFNIVTNSGTTGYWSPNGIQIFELLSVLTFLQWLWPTSINSIVPGGWSIAIEMLFYLLFPLIALSFKKNISCYFFIASLYIGGYFFKQFFLIDLFNNHLKNNELHLIDWFFYFWLPKQSICFGFGIILYQIIKKNKVDYLGLFLLLICAMGSNLGRSVIFLFLFCYFTLSLNLKNNTVSSFGATSYSMYLIHFYIIDMLAKIYTDKHYFELAFPLVLAITFLLSQYVTKPLIENQSKKIGEKFLRFLQKNRLC